MLLRTHLLEVPGRRVAVVIGRSGGGGGRGWAPGAAPLPSLVWTVSAVIRRCLPFPPHPIIPMVGGGCWRGCGRRSHLPAEDSLKVYHWQHCWVKAVSVLREGWEKDQVWVTGNTTGSKLSLCWERGGKKTKCGSLATLQGQSCLCVERGGKKTKCGSLATPLGQSCLSVLRGEGEKTKCGSLATLLGQSCLSVLRGEGEKTKCGSLATLQGQSCLSVLRGEGEKTKCGSLATLLGQSCLSVLREGRGKNPSVGHWQHYRVKAVSQCWERGGEKTQVWVTGNTAGSKLSLSVERGEGKTKHRSLATLPGQSFVLLWFRRPSSAMATGKIALLWMLGRGGGRKWTYLYLVRSKVKILVLVHLTQCHSGRQMAAACENLTTREITPHTMHTCQTK